MCSLSSLEEMFLTDYGCIVYGSARRSYLRMLDPIQNHALRLCLGAYRTSPASSLCMAANESVCLLWQFNVLLPDYAM